MFSCVGRIGSGAGRYPDRSAAATDKEASVSKDVWQRIEEARARWNVLEHPFYQRWSAGELSAEELAEYSGQYRHATAAIAELSAAVAKSAPESERDSLRRHAAEEQAHVALWDGFVAAVGGRADAVPTAETRECVAAWTAEGDRVSQLARLYAIESGQPAISRTKREGLADHYGVGDGPGNEYFRVHEKADVHHAAEGRSLIEAHLADADQDALVAAAESAFRANWRLLDGVSTAA
jgi:pyrroloquinoline-quinone synthase